MSVVLKRTKQYHYYRALLGTIMLALGMLSIVDICQNFTTQWYWLIFAVTFANIVDDTFSHRICGHNMFRVDVNSITYKIFVFATAVLQGYGPNVLTVIWHRAHHMYADQGKKDTLNPREFWFREAFSLPYTFIGSGTQYENPTEIVNRSLRVSEHIIRDPWTRFCEKHDLIISIATLTLLYFLAPILLFKLVLTARVMTSVNMMLAAIGHIKLPFAYRNFDTPDNSYNHIILYYALLGLTPGVLQNNHHGMPRTHNIRYKWWEIDPTVPLVLLLRYLMEDKQASTLNED